MKTILNNYQIETLAFLKQDPYIMDDFWFSGGTALAEGYLQHRLSDDLDFFTTNAVNSFTIDTHFNNGKVQGYISARTKHKLYERHLYQLNFPDGFQLKLEFSQYFKPLHKLNSYQQFHMESKYDLMLNKIACIQDRYDPKDYFDLYYLWHKEKKLDLESYLKDYEQKFGNHVSLQAFGYSLFKGTTINVIPHIIDKSLKLATVHAFFRSLAKELPGGLV